MATQLALSIWQLFWGDSIGVCLQATVAFVVRVAWPQWSASLRSASIPAAATQEPPSLHNPQHHNYQRHSVCFVRFRRLILPPETRNNICNMTGEITQTLDVISLLLLSQSVSPKINSSSSAEQGTRRVQRLKSNTDGGG